MKILKTLKDRMSPAERAGSDFLSFNLSGTQLNQGKN